MSSVKKQKKNKSKSALALFDNSHQMYEEKILAAVNDKGLNYLRSFS